MKYGNDLTRTESRRICIFLLHIAVVAGIAVGAAIVAAKKDTDLSGEWWLHQYFAPAYSGNTVLAVFRNTFVSSAVQLVLIMLLGFFSLGQPFGAALLVYRGVGIGASVASMYMISGAGSLLPILVLVVPKAIILSYISVLGVREAFRLSAVQLRFLFRDELPEAKMKRAVKLYFVKFLVLAAIIMLVSAADSVMNYIFMDLY